MRPVCDWHQPYSTRALAGCCRPHSPTPTVSPRLTPCLALPLFSSYTPRSSTPTGAPVPQLLLQPLDLSDLVCVRRAAGELLGAEPGGIHMLILNAGIMACPLMWVQQCRGLGAGAGIGPAGSTAGPARWVPWGRGLAVGLRHGHIC